MKVPKFEYTIILASLSSSMALLFSSAASRRGAAIRNMMSSFDCGFYCRINECNRTAFEEKSFSCRLLSRGGDSGSDTVWELYVQNKRHNFFYYFLLISRLNHDSNFHNYFFSYIYALLILMYYQRSQNGDLSIPAQFVNFCGIFSFTYI